VTGDRRWAWRALVGVLILAAVKTIAVITHTSVDHLRLVLVVAVVVAAAGLVVDAAQVESIRWHVTPERGDQQGSADPRTAAYLRILESHLTAREPGSALRDRLGDLADQVLHLRHGLSRNDPAATAILGPELHQVLNEPPRRLGVDEIHRCVRRIEEL
jgi:hypothetical protein